LTVLAGFGPRRRLFVPSLTPASHVRSPFVAVDSQ